MNASSIQKNDSRSAGKNMLFVARSWRPGDTGGLTARRRRLLEYRANPRSLEYMLEQASRFKKEYAPEAKADLYVTEEISVPEKHLSEFRQIHTHFPHGPDFDTIVLLFPDAVGLGWGGLERSLLSLAGRHYWVINGRRRVFRWDPKIRRILAGKRILYHLSFLEILLVFPVVILGAGYALKDRIIGKKGKDTRR